MSRQLSFEWIFSPEKRPISWDELGFRQKLSVFIFDMGRALNKPDHCIATAIVYMHRFYMVHSLEGVLPQRICMAALFLACKVEETLCRSKNMVNAFWNTIHQPNHCALSEEMNQHYCEKLFSLENLLLATLGFSLNVQQPQSIIQETISKLESQVTLPENKTFAQLSADACKIAAESIIFTPFCVQYASELIACFCIQLALDQAGIDIHFNHSTDEFSECSKCWIDLIDPSFTKQKIQNLIDDYQLIYTRYPDAWKNRLFGANRQNAHGTVANEINLWKRSPLSSNLIEPNLNQPVHTSSMPGAANSWNSDLFGMTVPSTSKSCLPMPNVETTTRNSRNYSSVWNDSLKAAGNSSGDQHYSGNAQIAKSSDFCTKNIPKHQHSESDVGDDQPRKRFRLTSPSGTYGKQQ